MRYLILVLYYSEAGVAHAAVDDSDGHPDGDILHHVSHRHQPHHPGLGGNAGGGNRSYRGASRESVLVFTFLPSKKVFHSSTDSFLFNY